MQTSAVYLESRIKTYGFKEHLDLCLVEISSDKENLTECGLFIEGLEDLGIRFELVFIHNSQETCIRIYILFEKKWEEQAIKTFKENAQNISGLELAIIHHVGLVYFYGPHFGDRFGIADAALKSLEKENIPIIATECNGSSIYLVFPEEMTEKAKQILEQEFEVPRHVKK